MNDNLDKIGDEFLVTPNCVSVSNKTQPCSSPGSFNGRSEFSSSSIPAGYYGQNGGGTIPRNHRRLHQHYSTGGGGGIVESHFLSPSSQASAGSASSARRHLPHPLNGSASMVAEPGLDADDLMNDDSDSASQQSSRPAGKSKNANHNDAPRLSLFPINTLLSPRKTATGSIPPVTNDWPDTIAAVAIERKPYCDGNFQSSS
ncbi:hypothetical protein DAPPUDRAFT_248298 [Daphnia pulex]|uniref:Uncharacterized protein n=1 Tax=Daphnia pulex TaxID=6669 RepID=E9GU48_DAPPU|nr:hypothetical protein DAPPUDRAFT_248298 [Daphnia pulex]|eukprot:EFX77038.1 hypothetical protein DAPPUDRAFT_248298 [Daphnia pulex]